MILIPCPALTVGAIVDWNRRTVMGDERGTIPIWLRVGMAGRSGLLALFTWRAFWC